jgi:signal peptidase I
MSPFRDREEEEVSQAGSNPPFAEPPLPSPSAAPPWAGPPSAGPALPAAGAEAPPLPDERPPASPRRRGAGSLFEVAVVVLLALFIALLLKVYVAEAYEIKGKSMEPTFLPEQRVMLLKVFYGIRRGDIIIFSSAENCQKDLIKRVIGLPGDRVEMKDGEVYVNGERIPEPYLSGSPWREGHKYHEYRAAEPVRPGKYYVLGDNRPDSQDSRAFHPIDASSIKGKVILRWWPLERLGSF